MCGTTTITITFSATTANPFPPTISDGTTVSSTQQGDQNLTTGVANGNVVVFQKAGDITAITAITDESGNVFSVAPTLQADGTWKGVVGNFPTGTTESYSVTYTVGETSYTQDPKLRMN